MLSDNESQGELPEEAQAPGALCPDQSHPSRFPLGDRLIGILEDSREPVAPPVPGIAGTAIDAEEAGIEPFAWRSLVVRAWT